MMKVETLENFPPNENPFHHDLMRMGVRIGKNVMAMMHNHDNAVCEDVIIVNMETGERIRVVFRESDSVFHTSSDFPCGLMVGSDE